MMLKETSGSSLGACEASKVGTLIDREKINIAPATKEICDFQSRSLEANF